MFFLLFVLASYLFNVFFNLFIYFAIFLGGRHPLVSCVLYLSGGGEGPGAGGAPGEVAPTLVTDHGQTNKQTNFVCLFVLFCLFVCFVLFVCLFVCLSPRRPEAKGGGAVAERGRLRGR